MTRQTSRSAAGGNIGSLGGDWAKCPAIGASVGAVDGCLGGRHTKDLLG